MLAGMALDRAGHRLAGSAFCPRAVPPRHGGALATIAPPEDAPLTRAHWRLMLVLGAALIIDIMKPASLGFVTPGMRAEYGIDRAVVALLPFSALCGTAVGSFVWGLLADLYGRRASILLSSVMFVGTSICGAMPSFWWNVFMCFMMGAAAGGLLPVANALLAETMPTRHRGWSLVLVGGIGAIGGYFAASALSALLQPDVWLAHHVVSQPSHRPDPDCAESASAGIRPLPAAYGPYRRSTRGAGAVWRRRHPGEDVDEDAGGHAPLPPTGFAGTTTALTLLAPDLGPGEFRSVAVVAQRTGGGRKQRGAVQHHHRQSTLLAAPTILITAWLYSAWSTKWRFADHGRHHRPGAWRAAIARHRFVSVLGQSCPAHRSSDLGRVGRDLDAAALHIGKLSRKSARPRHRLGRRLQQDRRPDGPGAERAGAGSGYRHSGRHDRCSNRDLPCC